MRRVSRLIGAALAAGVLVASAAPSLADCYYNGQSVPEGTSVGGLICRDGQWVPE